MTQAKAKSTRSQRNRPKRRTFKSWLRDNALSIVTISIFLLSWLGQSITGNFVYNDDAKLHGQRQLNYFEYLTSAHFWEATSENWESEFLQLSAMVVLTIFLRQKGSAESKKRLKLPNERPRRPLGRWLYENSLGLALFTIFVACFTAHVVSSYYHNKAEQIAQGEAPTSPAEFIVSSQLWFESFQNWQSEFLAVASLTMLTIFLRQKGSAESKEVNASNEETGK